jgi:hypothetical protein
MNSARDRGRDARAFGDGQVEVEEVRAGRPQSQVLTGF